MRILTSGLRAVLRKKRVKSTTWVKSVTDDDDTIFREEKRVFQADSEALPQKSPIIIYRDRSRDQNKQLELKCLDAAVLALQVATKGLELTTLQLKQQQPPRYRNLGPSSSEPAYEPAPDSTPWAGCPP